MDTTAHKKTPYEEVIFGAYVVYFRKEDALNSTKPLSTEREEAIEALEDAECTLIMAKIAVRSEIGFQSARRIIKDMREKAEEHCGR